MENWIEFAEDVAKTAFGENAGARVEVYYSDMNALEVMTEDGGRVISSPLTASIGDDGDDSAGPAVTVSRVTPLTASLIKS